MIDWNVPVTIARVGNTVVNVKLPKLSGMIKSLRLILIAATLGGAANGWSVDPNLRGSGRGLHRGVQGSAWRKDVVVRSLEKADRGLRVLERVQPELAMAAIRMARTKGCSVSHADAAVYGLDF